MNVDIRCSSDSISNVYSATKMIIHLDPGADQDLVIEQAKSILLRGGLVACPTESFYGLAVDAANESAIQRLFFLKQRDPGRPVLILIHSAECLRKYAGRIPPIALPLIQRFWPGGLTLIFEASGRISPLLTGGTHTIGIRWSSHPIPTALTRAIQGAVTGTSVNPSGAPPCRRADQVTAYFDDKIDLIIDAGETPGGTGSTVLDVTRTPPEIIRHGMISQEEVEEVIGALRQ
ncbi:MAG: threonylcarbamoyl-AMP synthase [Deltaproteobacteria bacterium]|nr:threonylcarbamoyl-AMP synthase [Deltaproteobacteria bacterium]OQX63773.1 MAG: threonylcarbamoyl-AMP synthase [Desulfococcus sp. 4484_242]